jgi:hypothetical protein
VNNKWFSYLDANYPGASADPESSLSSSKTEELLEVLMDAYMH